MNDNQSYQITDNVLVQLSNEQDVEYSVWVSYLELYNENIYDLLQPPPEAGLNLLFSNPRGCGETGQVWTCPNMSQCV